LNQALKKYDWHPGLARGHEWAFFLESLKNFELGSFSNLKDLSSLQESEAQRLFELLSLSVSEPRAENAEGEGLWFGFQGRALKILSWMGIKHRTLKAPRNSECFYRWGRETFRSSWLSGSYALRQKKRKRHSCSF
jgi:hypothetical protein